MEKITLKRFLVSMILIIVTCILSTVTSYNRYNNYTETDSIVYVDSLSHNVLIKNALIKEVSTYISYQAPKANETHVNKISNHLVSNCLENDLDICFVMSQTQLETNFGTLGAGRSSSRKSLFGVANKKYDTYENAIIDYIDILQRLYLVNGKTENNLLHNYVNKNGHRYAENVNYERHLRTTYNYIKRNTSIYELQQNLNAISKET